MKVVDAPEAENLLGRARTFARRTIDHGEQPAQVLDDLQYKIRNSFREALVPTTRRRPAILTPATEV